MKNVLLLWKLEGKHMLQCFPKLFLEMVILLGILGAVIYGSNQIFYENAPLLHMTIGVVEEEENPATDLLLSYVQTMESTAKHCQFEVLEKEEGFALLKQQKIAALLVLPNQMVEGILTGNAVSVQVYFPKDAGLESALFKELTIAGMGMLQVAQAEIYSIYDTALAYDAMEQLSVLEADINAKNLAFALDRMVLYQQQQVSATGNLSWIAYGIASGSIFFLLLLGIAVYPLIKPYARQTAAQLARQGIGIGAQEAGKWLSGFCMLALSLIGAGILCYGGIFYIGISSIEMSGIDRFPIGGQQILSFLLILVCITTFLFMLNRITDNYVSAVLWLFFLSIFMMYCSGGFLPSAFLPKQVQLLGKFLPTTYLIQAAGSLFTGEITGQNIGMLIGYTCLFALLSFGAEKSNRRKK